MLAVLNQLGLDIFFLVKDLICYQSKDKGAPASSVQPLPSPVGLAYVGEESCSRLSRF